MLVVSFLCNSIYIRLYAESVGGIQWWASESWLLASGAAASAVCVATASMGGLDSAAAAAARLVADAYMAAPADVVAAPATAAAAVPVKCMDFISRDKLYTWTCMDFAVWTCMDLT